MIGCNLSNGHVTECVFLLYLSPAVECPINRMDVGMDFQSVILVREGWNYEQFVTLRGFTHNYCRAALTSFSF